MDQSLMDVHLADSVEEKVPRKARPKPVFKLKGQPKQQDDETTGTDNTSDTDSPREHLAGAHRRVGGGSSSAAVPNQAAASAPPMQEEASSAPVASPRGGKFAGFMTKTQNAVKHTISKTLGRKNNPATKELAPLEDWDEADDHSNANSANTLALNSDDTTDIPASVASLPMQRNERPLHCFPNLLWAYDFHNQDAMRVGVCYITNADFGFLPDEESVEGFRVPLQMVASVGKVGKKSGKGELYYLNFQLHDFRSFRLAVPKTSDQRGTLYDVVMQSVFVDSPQQFFAFSRERTMDGNGWNIYVAESEWLRQFERLRALKFDVNWRVCINSDYVICSTYPKLLVVPQSVLDELVANAASFRSRGRFPALSHLHTNGRCITRASQPMVGIKGHRSTDDEELVEAIRTSFSSTDTIMIFDARPKVNAVANQAMGKGFESEKLYKQSRVKFLNIANIHVMRESIHKMTDAIALSQTAALSSDWIEHVKRILVSAVTVAAAVHIDAMPCLVHCSDGWDRTSQLTSLAMIMLDPFYRTIEGFAIVIEKEWLSFGHRFAQRTGHEPRKMSNVNDPERSPVFLQFCDCVFQLTKMCPCAFEFNDLLLDDLMDAVYSCHFGTFLFDSDKERDEAQLKSKTESFWSFVLKRRESKLYNNVFYDPKAESGVVLPSITSWNIVLWPYYLRYHERRPKERNRPVIAPRSIEEAFRALKEENERLLTAQQAPKWNRFKKEEQ